MRLHVVLKGVVVAIHHTSRASAHSATHGCIVESGLVTLLDGLIKVEKGIGVGVTSLIVGRLSLAHRLEHLLRDHCLAQRHPVLHEVAQTHVEAHVHAHAHACAETDPDTDAHLLGHQFEVLLVLHNLLLEKRVLHLHLVILLHLRLHHLLLLSGSQALRCLPGLLLLDVLGLRLGLAVRVLGVVSLILSFKQISVVKVLIMDFGHLVKGHLLGSIEILSWPGDRAVDRTGLLRLLALLDGQDLGSRGGALDGGGPLGAVAVRAVLSVEDEDGVDGGAGILSG